MKLYSLKRYMYLLICISLCIFIIKYSNILSIINFVFKLLLPIFIGLFYAWFVNPLICKIKLKRNISALIVFLSIILFIILFLLLVIPLIYQEIKELVLLLPKFTDNIYYYINKFNLSNYIDLDNFNLDNIPLLILSNIKKIVCNISTVIIGLMIGLYVSFDYDVLYNYFIKYVSNKDLLNEISDKVRCSFKGTLIVSFIVFVLDSIYFLIIKLDGAVILGILCGLTDLIPYVGPYIGGLVALVVAISQGGKIWILTIVGCVIVQILENNVFQPCIVSKATRLSPLLVIIGITLFGKLLGILGMIIATPLVCVFSIVFKYYFYDKHFTN